MKQKGFENLVVSFSYTPLRRALATMSDIDINDFLSLNDKIALVTGGAIYEALKPWSLD